jgi:hypothetical protein
MKKIFITSLILLTGFFIYAQNVGIGTVTPASKLSIEGTDNTLFSRNAVLQLTNTAAGSNNYWLLRPGATGTTTPPGGFSIGDKTSNRFIIDSNGNTGIGMNPSLTLDVARGNNTNGTARFNGTNYPSQFNYGANEYTYISGGMANSYILLNFFGGGNVGIGQSIIPSSQLEVARGNGQATAYFRGTTYHSIFNQGSNEDTYIRGGKLNSDIYLNDINGGKIRVGGNSTPTASLEVSRGNGTNGTAMFRGTSYHTTFNTDVAENTYLQGGKAGSNILLNYYGGANVGVGNNLVPSSSFEVARGTGLATANFHGSTYSSLFNNGTNEETFIRGGKAGSDVYINDNTSANVRIGGTTKPTATLDVSRGFGTDGTAVFRGSVYTSQFNKDSVENTFIRGGKMYSVIYLNDINNGDVKIGGNGLAPAAALDISKGLFSEGTALFRGSNYNTIFNSGTTEDSYIRGGKNGSNIYINDNNAGMVKIGSPNPPIATLDVDRGTGTTTAAFKGSNFGSFFNSGSSEDTYINGGKTNSRVIINETTGGKTGIGVFPSITDGVLDVNGRMRIRSGGSQLLSAGIWLNNTSNTAQAAFLGMEDSVHVGLKGTGAIPPSLLMNTVTGALSINGAEGASGEILTSNGAGQAPSWGNSTNPLYNNSNLYTQQSTAHVTCSACFTDLISTSAVPFTVTGNSKVLVTYSGFVNPLSSGLFASDSRVNIRLFIYDVNSSFVRDDDYNMIAFHNGGSSFSKTANLFSLLPGTYYYRLSVTLFSGDTGAGTDLSQFAINSIIIKQ